MKILLGVDSSAHCRATVSSVCAMQWPRGTHVVLVSVVTPVETQFAPEPHVIASAGGAIDLIEADHLKAHEELLAGTEQRLRNAGLKTTSRICLGEPDHVLVDQARAEGADLVVVGCHGHSGLGRRLLGSVATHVVAHAPCNVLVIKRDGPPIED